MNGKDRIKKVCKPDAVGFRNKAKKTPVSIETPRTTLLNNLKARFVMAIKEDIGHTAGRILVGELKCL